jgi:hypothetical protein
VGHQKGPSLTENAVGVSSSFTSQKLADKWNVLAGVIFETDAIVMASIFTIGCREPVVQMGRAVEYSLAHL